MTTNGSSTPVTPAAPVSPAAPAAPVPVSPAAPDAPVALIVANTLVSRVGAKRPRSQAEVQRENSIDTQRARVLYNRAMPAMTHRGSRLYQRVCDYDAVAHMIMSRDTAYRLQFVNGIKEKLERQYAFALQNDEDQTFRRQFDRFFKIIRSESAIASMLQMFLVHVAILLEPEVERWLMPATPDPDAVGDEAIDMADVDRAAFQIYVQQYLLPYFGDLLNSGTMSVLRMVRELNAAYTALMPPDPLDAAVRDNARRIHFSDTEAQEAVRQRWGERTRMFKGVEEVPETQPIPPPLHDKMAPMAAGAAMGAGRVVGARGTGGTGNDTN